MPLVRGVAIVARVVHQHAVRADQAEIDAPGIDADARRA